MLKCLLAKPPRQARRVPRVATGSHLGLATSPRLDSVFDQAICAWQVAPGFAVFEFADLGYMIRPMCPHPQDHMMSEVRLQGFGQCGLLFDLVWNVGLRVGDYL